MQGFKEDSKQPFSVEGMYCEEALFHLPTKEHLHISFEWSKEGYFHSTIISSIDGMMIIISHFSQECVVLKDQHRNRRIISIL